MTGQLQQKACMHGATVASDEHEAELCVRVCGVPCSVCRSVWPWMCVDAGERERRARGRNKGKRQEPVSRDDSLPS